MALAAHDDYLDSQAFKSWNSKIRLVQCEVGLVQILDGVVSTGSLYTCGRFRAR